MKRLITCFCCFLSLANTALAESANNQIAHLKIGMLLPLSGQYAAIGTDSQQGAEIAKQEIGAAANIEFIFADSKADPNQAISEFRKLVNVDHVAGVFAFRGPVGMAISPLSKTAKVSLLGGVGNRDFAQQNEYAFQLWPRSDVEGQYLAERLHELGFKKIALVTAQDDWPVAVSAGVRERASKLGLSLVYDQELLPTDLDLRSQITKLRSAQPEVIFLNVSLGQIAPFLRQLKDLGITAPVFSNYWAGKKEVIAAGGDAIEGVRYVEMATNYAGLKKDLASRFGATPSGATLSTYVATIMLAQAAQGASEIDAATLYSRLSALGAVKTRNGTFQVRDRVVEFPMTLRTIRNGVVDDFK
jgi:branched-chain amino acid transport system substrate-binding protein